MRRLILIRHAHADAAGVDDHARALSRRGRQEAEALGRWLAASGFVPDRVIVSTARRAEETWRLAAAAAGLAEGRETPSEVLYEAPADGLLALVAVTSDAAGTLALVGHNPSLQELAAFLADDDGRGPLIAGFPPATTAVLDFSATRWAAIRTGGAHLAGFATPRPPEGAR